MKSVLRPWPMLLGVLLLAQAAFAEPSPSHGSEESFAVRLADEEVIRVSESRPNRTAQERASGATVAIEQAVRSGALEVRTRSSEFSVTVYAGDLPVLEIFPEDSASLGRSSPQVVADEVAAKLRRMLRREKARSKVAQRVLGGSSVAFLGLLGLLLLRFAGQMSKRALRRIQREGEGEGIGALRFHTLELLPAAATREGLRLAVIGGLWIARLGIIYAWIISLFSLFSATRPLVEKATGYLLTPALDLINRAAARLPVVIALLLALAVVLLVIRFITLYTNAVARQEIESEWLRAETARTTGTLLVVATSLTALLFLTPLLAGTSEGSLTRIGVLGLGALALGATPYIASCVLGIRAVYGNTFQRGDQLEYGGQSGSLVAIALFDLTLLAEDGAEIRVPHLMSLWRPTRIKRKTDSPAEKRKRGSS